MYETFFGFREKPFKLTPNPAYLFLSRSHEEALAHLRYAVSEGEGFIEITGEVGTGKTTLCRVFLESLDDGAEAAYVFNPNLDAAQLLGVINEELGIDSPSDKPKDLVGALNAFLLEKKAQGKNVIIIVDEAQNLDSEVLEQLRLLSNLETATEKLLQIVLVGQPELRDKLNSYELRQLGQRITLNLSLIPLSMKETEDYIYHRIHIASRGRTVRFERAALNHIFNYSKGVPRLVNILCDRSLLAAFSMNRPRVDAEIAKIAIREMKGESAAEGFRKKIRGLMPARGLMPVFSLSALILVIAIFVFFFSRLQTPDPAIVPALPGGAAVPSPPSSSSSAGDLIPKAPDQNADGENAAYSRIEAFLRDARASDSRRGAFETVMDMWRPGDRAFISDEWENMEDERYFQAASQENGFWAHPLEWRLDLVEKLDIPAILSFYLPEAPLPVHLALTGISGGKTFLLSAGRGKSIRVGRPELELYWSGNAVILWRDFLSMTGTIPLDAPDESILILKTLLNEILEQRFELNPVYDYAVRRSVMDIQRQNGLAADGMVGSLTKIILYNMRGGFDIPRIGKGRRRPGR
ncbi:conserved hypothetical protein [Candidatus Desulfarcum epimagneticum]|uniref:AAA+ ATPase domain-containing protein n=1 Tax=uncultured Desulfobacteraceae bacterium TaxID=218296 RepID=A0A484HFN1_9BACT|nr:conserved hypothetical protein [uncultured Desulfobacteraceae bacterium]